MKSRSPTSSEIALIRSVVDPICGDPVNAKLIVFLALYERFSHMDDFSAAYLSGIVAHHDVAKALAMAKIATGQSDNSIASDDAPRALEAARAKVASMYEGAI